MCNCRTDLIQDKKAPSVSHLVLALLLYPISRDWVSPGMATRRNEEVPRSFVNPR